MAEVVVTIPREFYASINKLMDNMSKFTDMTKQMQQSMVRVQTANLNIPQVHSFNSVFRHLDGLFGRFKLVLMRSTERILMSLGAQARNFIRTMPDITRIMRVSSVLKFIKPAVAGLPIVGPPIAIFLQIGFEILRWLESKYKQFIDYMQKDYLESISARATMGGLRAFRITFAELPEDPGYMQAIEQMRGNITTPAAVTVMRFLGIKQQADEADTMVLTLLAMQQFMKAQPSGRELPYNPLLQLAGPEFLLALRTMSRERLRELIKKYYERKPGLTPSDESVQHWLRFNRDFQNLWQTSINAFGQVLSDAGVVQWMTKTVEATQKEVNAIEDFVGMFSRIMIDKGMTAALESAFNSLANWLLGQGLEVFENLKKLFNPLLEKFNEWLRVIQTYIDKTATLLKEAIITPAHAEPSMLPGGRLAALPPAYEPGAPSPTATPGLRPEAPMAPGPQFRPGVTRPGLRPSPTPPSGEGVRPEPEFPTGGGLRQPVSATPEEQKRSSGPYGPENIGTRSGGAHAGADLTVPRGTKVYAMVDGTIISNNPHGSVTPDGPGVVTLKGDDGHTYYYMHMPHDPNLKVGTHVKAGEQIGTSGVGNGVPHVHLEIWAGKRLHSQRIDARKVLNYNKGKAVHGGEPVEGPESTQPGAQSGQPSSKPVPPSNQPINRQYLPRVGEPIRGVVPPSGVRGLPGGPSGPAIERGAPGAAKGTGTIGWWTPDRANHAVNRLMTEGGLSEHAAKALVSRWAFEAPKGPTDVNRSSGAYGIAQWLGSRKPGAIAAGDDFDNQLSYAIKELHTNEKAAGDRLRAARTPEEGAAAASSYERAERPFIGRTMENYHTLFPAGEAGAAGVPTRVPRPNVDQVDPYAPGVIRPGLPGGPSGIDPVRLRGAPGTPGTPTAPGVAGLPGGPSGPAAERPKGTMLFLHGMQSKYSQGGVSKTPEQVEAEARRYAQANGLKFESINVSGDNQQEQEKAARERIAQGGITHIAGFSAGGNTAIRLRNDFPKLQYTIVQAGKHGEISNVNLPPGTKHMNAMDALATQAEQQKAQGTQNAPRVEAPEQAPGINVRDRNYDGYSPRGYKTAEQAGIRPEFPVADNVNWQLLNAEYVARLNETYRSLPDEEKANVKMISGYRPTTREEARQLGMDPHSSQEDIWERSDHGRLFSAARPGSSRHQGGEAADFEPSEGGNVSMGREGAKHGVTRLYNRKGQWFDKPHIQLNRSDDSDHLTNEQRTHPQQPVPNKEVEDKNKDEGKPKGEPKKESKNGKSKDKVEVDDHAHTSPDDKHADLHGSLKGGLKVDNRTDQKVSVQVA